MNRAIISFAVLAMSGLLPIMDRSTVGPAPGGTPHCICPPVTPPPKDSIGALTPRQQMSAFRLVLKDAYMKRLLRGQSYRLGALVPWAGPNKKLLGAVVDFSLNRVAAINGYWYLLDFDCTERTSPPYGRLPYRATYAHVTAVTVFVDLKRRVVAGITNNGTLTGAIHYLHRATPHLQPACRP
jgi:hypothetical protein